MKSIAFKSLKFVIGGVVAASVCVWFMASKEKEMPYSSVSGAHEEPLAAAADDSSSSIADSALGVAISPVDKVEPTRFTPFENWLREWKAGRADLQQGLALSGERKSWMERTIRQDPDLAYQHALDQDTWSKLPKELQQEVEHRFEGIGSYKMFTDCETGQTWSQIKLNDIDNGDAVVAPSLADRTAFKGVMKGVTFGKLTAAVAMEGTTTLTGLQAAPAAPEPPPVTGIYKVLWLNVKFADETVWPSTDSAAVSHLGSVASSYNTYSYGQLSINSEVLSVSIAANKVDNPSADTVMFQADNAAVAAGKVLSNYSTVIYRQTSYGQFAGLSNTMGPGYVMISKTQLDTSIHEIAHNMGVSHANWWKTNTGQPAWGAGINQLYGEDWDAMAFDAPRGDFNLPEKAQLGWVALNTDYVHDVGSGVYRIYDHTKNTRNFSTVGVNGAYYGVSVFKDTETVNGQFGPRRYMLSYRDRTAVGATQITEGLYLHWPRWTKNGSDATDPTYNGPYGSDIIDTHPTTNAVNDAPLAVGETYVDNDPGNRDGPLYITVLSKTNPDGIARNGDEYLDVKVVVGDQTGNSAPSGTLTFAKSIVGPGEAVAMSVSASDPNGDTLAYLWDFGLGATVANKQAMATNGSPNQSFTYATQGTYTVKVTISDGRGGTTQVSKVITVSNTPPVVNAGADQSLTLVSSTSWSPADISTLAWYDAADPALVAGAVTQWNDKSGNGRHVLQATAVKKPTFSATGWDGTRPSLSFDGGDTLTSAAISNIGAGERTVFIVYDSNATPTVANQYLLDLKGGAEQYYYAVTGSVPKLIYKGSATSTAISTGVSGKHVAAFGNDVRTRIYKDGVMGVDDAVNQIANNTITSINVGGRGASEYFQGAIAELVIVPFTMSDSERQVMEGYLAHKWALTANLPVGHPFKTTPPSNLRATANLSGSVSDINTGQPITFKWSPVSGPAPVSLANPKSLNGSARFSTPGTYTLRLTASDSYVQAFDDVVITVGDGTYSVSYNGNGNDGGTAPVDGVTRPSGATATVLGNTGNLTKAGNSFAGWNTQANGSGISYAAGATFVMPSSNVVLYAQWTSLPTYTVSYSGNSNEGGAIPSNQTKTQGVALTLAGNSGALTKSGYAFAGWNTAANGGGTSYLAGASYTTDANLMLYAQWAPLSTYQVIYSGNSQSGGTVPSIQTKTQGINLTLASNSGGLVKTGYTFAGWNTSAAGTGADFAPGATYATDAAITLYAKWNALPTVNAGTDQSVVLSSVPWSPSALAPQLWVDATTATINAGTVSVANAGSGGGTLSGPASLVNSGIGNLQAVQFNGTNQYLTGNYTNTGSTLSAFFVGKSLNTSQIAYAGMMSVWANGQANDWNNAGSSVLFNQNNTTANSIQTYRNAALSSTAGTLTAGFVAGTVYSGTTNTSYLNGTAATAVSSSGNFNAGKVVLGARWHTSIFNYSWNGNFGEALVFNANLSATDRQKVEGYLAHKWALGTSLPSTHPYLQAPPQNSGVVVNLSGNAADGDVVSSTWTMLSGPSGATVVFGNASAVNTTATLTQAGAYVFRLTANDGFSTTTDDVAITVNSAGSNTAPVASNGSATTNEDAAVAVVLGATDAESNPLTYTVVTAPTKGTLSGTAPNLTYTPNANTNGADSFTFKVNDGTVDSNVATVNLTVTAVNDAPVANNGSATTNEDTAVTVNLVASDIDSVGLTYTVVTAPAKGALSGTAPNLTYTPNANANGADSFTFKVNDGTVDSNVATVSLTVNAVNDAPVASNGSSTTNEDSAVAVNMVASDIDSAGLTYTVVTAPAKGTLSGTAPNLTYTPNANANGADSFTFKVNDGTVDSNVATVSLTVNAVNDAPVASNGLASTNEDTAVAVVLTGSDIDSTGLIYTVVAAPTKGALSGTAPNLTYTPNANANGADSFTFMINDGTLNSNVATVSLTVTAVNDAPLVKAGSSQTLAIGSGFVWEAYHDLGATIGSESTGNITTHQSGPSTNSTNVLDVGSKSLIKYSDGSSTGVSLSIAGANAMDSRTGVIAPPSAGTPASALFAVAGLNLSNGYIYEGGVDGSGSTTITITGLNPGELYDFAIYGDRASTADGVERFTLGGADSATNRSAIGIVNNLVTDMETRPNSTAGNVVRWKNINPGADGIITVSIDPEAGGNLSNIAYLSAIRLAQQSPSSAVATLDGTVSDVDGADVVTTSWSVVSAPAGAKVVFGDAAAVDTTATFSADGDYTLRLTAGDAQVQSYDEVVVTVTSLPLPWVSADIGTAMLAGSDAYSAGIFTGTGSGVIGGTGDKMHYTYQMLSGDGEITARIRSLQNTGTSSRVGVMIRDSLASNAMQAFMGMSGSNAYQWANRTSTGGSTTTTASSTGTLPNTWVRLSRAGTTISAYKSADGITWTLVGSVTNTTFGANCYIGLAVGSGSDTTLNTSQFNNVSVTP